MIKFLRNNEKFPQKLKQSVIVPTCRMKTKTSLVFLEIPCSSSSSETTPIYVHVRMKLSVVINEFRRSRTITDPIFCITEEVKYGGAVRQLKEFEM
jgi:hypothetical protein